MLGSTMTSLPPASPRVDVPEPPLRKLRVALCAWEIGRPASGLGVKVGGLGHVVEELPAEVTRMAVEQGLDLEVETLSPCFAHFDKRRLSLLPSRLPVTLDGQTFEMAAFEHLFRQDIAFPDGSHREVAFRCVYFWDEWQLGWTRADAVYPSDPRMGLRLYAAVGQAMAGYIRGGDFQTVHLHDYHVGLVPFYLGDDFLRDVPVHLTIHNGSYQGITPGLDGVDTLNRLALPGSRLFSRYFDFFSTLNPMRACMLKVHEQGGRITTVSGDLQGSWGYAAELREDHASIAWRAGVLKNAPPVKVFVPNHHQDLFEKLPIAGITNGLATRARPEQMPELKADYLRSLKAKRGGGPLFQNRWVEEELLRADHGFDAAHLEVKQHLRRLVCHEVFGYEVPGYPVVFCAVGRLVAQKNFRLIAEIIPRVLDLDPLGRFLIVAKADEQDADSKAVEAWFFELAARYPSRVYFNNDFNPLLAKLVMAGSDFALVPSRFEPCGLTDYEAALLGTIPICRATGGLTKIRHCGYLYDWLDIGDWAGEVSAFFGTVRRAIEVFRHDHGRHRQLIELAMGTDTSWDRSAAQYVELYRYGLLAKRWLAARGGDPRRFIEELGDQRELFARFFAPGQHEHADPRDGELKRLLGA